MSKVKQKNYTQTISDENGVEFMVTYEVDYYEGEEWFENHYYASDITSAELVVAGKGIDVTSQLTEVQKDRLLKEFDESGYCDEIAEKRDRSHFKYAV